MLKMKHACTETFRALCALEKLVESRTLFLSAIFAQESTLISSINCTMSFLAFSYFFLFEKFIFITLIAKLSTFLLSRKEVFILNLNFVSWHIFCSYANEKPYTVSWFYRWLVAFQVFLEGKGIAMLESCIRNLS